MELIKKIKQAEVEAQETIEKAKADAAALVDQGRQERRGRQEEAEAQRRKAIDAAIEKAKFNIVVNPKRRYRDKMNVKAVQVNP